jgi:hypothetical protein
MGGSSGAHMALLAGLTQGIAEFEGSGGNPDTSSKIQGLLRWQCQPTYSRSQLEIN